MSTNSSTNFGLCIEEVKENEDLYFVHTYTRAMCMCMYVQVHVEENNSNTWTSSLGCDFADAICRNSRERKFIPQKKFVDQINSVMYVCTPYSVTKSSI